MKLETINALAQLIAALGMIASLFYLAAQIRQNTRSMRAIVVDSLAHSLVDLLQPMAQDPESMSAFSGSASLIPESGSDSNPSKKAGCT